MRPGIMVGKERYAKRRYMSSHVPSIGQQRHGTEPKARDNLRRHHDCRNNHDSRSPFFGQLGVAGKIVRMLPLSQRMTLHAFVSPDECCEPSVTNK